MNDARDKPLSATLLALKERFDKFRQSQDERVPDRDRTPQKSATEEPVAPERRGPSR